MSEPFRRGDVLAYPYLWRWQAEENSSREHGEKERPVCMILTVTDKQGLTHMLLLPISSKQPLDERDALEIPPLEMRRAGLTHYPRGWITITECNYDILERSYYLDQSQEVMGRFSEAYLEEIRKAFAPFLAQGTARVSRT
ncbi:hypothetical protein [Castellaniella sp.]|uniref:hypothetical protein n=1 Tax=Castellaniella sp. TaxID=1955812 RepID=UPI002AFF780A|nr:hypothetical protein [Castellaniella sp.]